MANTTKYEIFSAIGSTISLMEQDPIFEAETSRKALDLYLKANKLKCKVKVSASFNVQFKVTPLIYVDGKKYIDGRKRAMWYQIQH